MVNENLDELRGPKPHFLLSMLYNALEPRNDARVYFFPVCTTLSTFTSPMLSLSLSCHQTFLFSFSSNLLHFLFSVIHIFVPNMRERDIVALVFPFSTFLFEV